VRRDDALQLYEDRGEVARACAIGSGRRGRFIAMTPISDTPLALMRMALALLDKNGEDVSLFAIHLQTAIDARLRKTPKQNGNGAMFGGGELRGH
jgi:hypothetical protein